MRMRGSGHNNRLQCFVEDKRYVQCVREMWLTIAFFVFNVVLALGLTALAGGWRSPGGEAGLIFGLPPWYFFGGLLTSLIVVLSLVILVKGFFKEMPLDATPDDGTAQVEER